MLRRLQNIPLRGLETTYLDLPHCGEIYRVNLKRKVAARRFTLRVQAATSDIVLTIPARASLEDAKSFAERHAGWIGARLRRLPSRTHFNPGEFVPLRGVLHQITHRPAQHGTVWTEVPKTSEADAAAPLLCVHADLRFVPRRVQDFLVREARRDLEAAIACYSRQLGVRPRKMTLRDTTSRWGSCSSSGALNFSWRLIMAPPFVLDYLAAHEVAHLLHMNHSAEFWTVVASACPDSDRAEAWLKLHGAGLLRYCLENPPPGPASATGESDQPTGSAVAAAATSSSRLR